MEIQLIRLSSDRSEASAFAKVEIVASGVTLWPELEILLKRLMVIARLNVLREGRAWLDLRVMQKSTTLIKPEA